MGLKSSLQFLMDFVLMFSSPKSSPLTMGLNELISMLKTNALSKCQLDPELIKLSKASACWLKLLVMFLVRLPVLTAVALNAGDLKGI